MNNYEKAAQNFRAVLVNKPGHKSSIRKLNAINNTLSQNLLRKGISEYKNKQYKKSLAIFQKIKNIWLRSSKAEYNSALVYCKLKNFDKAKEGFQTVLKTNPDHTKAKYMLGRIYLNSGKHKQAKQLFENVLLRYPNNARVKKYLKRATYKASQRWVRWSSHFF